jgi:diguanylate cyclase (GGDEF)-like protein
METFKTPTKQEKPNLPGLWAWFIVFHAFIALSVIFITNDTLLNITNIFLSTAISIGVVAGIMYRKHPVFPWGFLSIGVIVIGISTLIKSLDHFGLTVNTNFTFWVEQVGILLVSIFAFAVMHQYEKRFKLKGFTIDFSLIVISTVCLIFLVSPDLLNTVLHKTSFAQQLLLIQVLVGSMLLGMSIFHHVLSRSIGLNDLIRIVLISLFVVHFFMEMLISFKLIENISLISRISWGIYLLSGTFSILFVFIEKLGTDDSSQTTNIITSNFMWTASILAILIIPAGTMLRWQLGLTAIDPAVISIASISLSSIVIWRLIILFTQSNQQRQQLASIVHTDVLTGLPNYLGYLDKLTNKRAENRLVIGINIDDFKAINDLYGRRTGDEVLKSLAHRLQQIPSLELVARTGPDLFLTVFYAPEQQIHSIVSHLKYHLGVWDTIHNQRIAVPLTYAASHSKKLIAPGTQVRQVEQALKTARDNHTSFELFSKGRNNKPIPRHELHEILQKAIDNNYLPIHFQPIYNLDDGSLKAMELLIRVESDEHGLLLPGQFLKQAQSYGQLTQLTKVCVRMVAEYFELLPCVTININIPPYMLDNTNILDEFISSFDATKMPAGRFCIEVTEDGDIPAENLTPAIKRLKDHGFSIAMDDFGTGYSTLARLSTLSMDSVKIDRSLLLSAVAGNKAVLEYAIDLVKRLGVTSVVEGVETLEELAMIRLMGADCVQGFLLSKPVHVSEAVNISLNAKTIEASF